MKTRIFSCHEEVNSIFTIQRLVYIYLNSLPEINEMGEICSTYG
jgi:hypothetical protein